MWELGWRPQFLKGYCSLGLAPCWALPVGPLFLMTLPWQSYYHPILQMRTMRPVEARWLSRVTGLAGHRAGSHTKASLTQCSHKNNHTKRVLIPALSLLSSHPYRGRKKNTQPTTALHCCHGYQTAEHKSHVGSAWGIFIIIGERSTCHCLPFYCKVIIYNCIHVQATKRCYDLWIQRRIFQSS